MMHVEIIPKATSHVPVKTRLAKPAIVHAWKSHRTLNSYAVNVQINSQQQLPLGTTT